MKFSLAILLSVVGLCAQINNTSGTGGGGGGVDPNAAHVNSANTFTVGAQNFTGAGQTLPFKTGTTLPATCTVGESFFKTNAAAGSNLYGCTATDTWSLQAGGGGGGAPGGSSPQLQFNSSGAFGGIANWTSDGTNLILPSTASGMPLQWRPLNYATQNGPLGIMVGSASNLPGDARRDDQIGIGVNVSSQVAGTSSNALFFESHCAVATGCTSAGQNETYFGVADGLGTAYRPLAFNFVTNGSPSLVALANSDSWIFSNADQTVTRMTINSSGVTIGSGTLTSGAASGTKWIYQSGHSLINMETGSIRIAPSDTVVDLVGGNYPTGGQPFDARIGIIAGNNYSTLRYDTDSKLKWSDDNSTFTAFSNLALKTYVDSHSIVGDVTGTLAASVVAKLNGTTITTNAAANQVILTTASAAAVWKSIPDCGDTGGNHLNFVASTSIFSCGSSGGGGGAPANYYTSTTKTGIGSASFVPSNTYNVLDPTATTGATSIAFGYNGSGTFTGANTSATSTTVRFVAGQSQGSTPIAEWDTNNGTRRNFVTEYGEFDGSTGTDNVAGIGSQAVAISNNIVVGGGIIGLGGNYTNHGGSFYAAIDTSITGKVTFGSPIKIGFASISTGSYAAMRDGADVAIARNAAGVLEIDSGTAGTFRDLKLRDIIIDGEKATTGTRYACLDTTGKIVSSTTACSGT